MQSGLDDYSSEAKSNMRSRAARVRRFLGYVNEHGTEFNRKMLIARFATENGVAPSTVYEYAGQLVDGGYLIVHSTPEDTHLLTIPDYEKIMAKQAGKS